MLDVPEALPHGLEAIEQCFESGRYFTAFRAAQHGGLLDIDRHTRPDHALFIGRLFRSVGANRRARKIILETWRRNRAHPRAAIFAMYELLNTDPFAALEWIEGTPELTGASDADRGDWECTRALSLMQLRDFSAADRAWEAAHGAHVDAWTWCVRAWLDDTRDRLDSALESLERARELRRWYRPAIELSARLLIRMRRAADARTLLAEACGHLESASTQTFLGMLHCDLGELDSAVSALMRAVAWAPAMDREFHDQLVFQLGHVHYLRGDVELATRLMRRSTNEQTRTVAERIEATAGARRKLAVPHVPQHHNTCAPATLTAIAEFWGARVDHLEIAEQICHDGTPAGSERRWAEEHGFTARQFTVTWDAAHALIDAGIPFALTTSFTLGAHLQPVAGYDERRRSLLVPDPSASGLVELDWERVAQSQAPFGPRGMVFVPTAQSAAVPALALPDAPLYEHNHAIETSLVKHDRMAAQRAYDQLAAAATANHYLRHQARRAIANYDGDEQGTVAWVSALRARYADHPWLRMCELSSLHGHASDERRSTLADGLLAEHRDDPAILVTCGRFLLGAGRTAEARAVARRAIRIAPQLASAYHLAADIAWGAGDRMRATRMYRIASCLAEGDESIAWSYFLAALITGDPTTALDYLGERVAHMQSRSGAPARTLCEAFSVVGRVGEALTILDAAIASHPDDGTLLLVATDQYRFAGDLKRAAERLEAARGKVPDPMWRRCAAALALQRDDTATALALRRQLVEDDPLDIGSQHAYVSLLERTGEADAARAHMLAACERFPFHIPLAKLCHHILHNREPELSRAQLTKFLERQPRSAWALQQLADWHMQRGQLDNARALLVRARESSDDLASLEVAEAALETRSGRRDAATKHLLTALRIDVDSSGAVEALLDLARDAAEATTLLDTVDGELRRQGSGGPGLLAYSNALREWCDPQTVLARLRAFRSERAYQWQAWAAEIDALLGAGRTDEAGTLASEAAQRFGQDLRAWRQLGIVEGLRGNRAAQIAALERALELDPHATEPMRRLADAHLAADDTVRARTILERALAEDPLGESNHGYLARVAKLEGDDATAVRHLERAIELEPEYVWGWQSLLQWSDDPLGVFQAARAALVRKPTAITPRVILARHAPDLSAEERVALFDEASKLAPGRVDLYDAKVELLARHERWAEALAACRPPFWGESPPTALIGRAAWVRFQRGERDAAIDDMLAAIRRTPSYAWGVEQLLSWGKVIGASVQIGKRLVEVAPQNATAHAVLGEAQREAGDDEGAEASFRRALEIDGTDHLARLGLFDVLFQRRAYDRAEPLLVALDRDHPWVMAKRVQILAATKRFDAADAELARMLRLEVEDPAPVDEAMSAYRATGQRARGEALLERLMNESDAPRAVATAWWKYVGKFVPPFRRWRRMRRWPKSPATDFAALHHVEQYGELGEVGGLAMFVVLNWRALRARTELWGSVGYCLMSTRHSRLARWWLRDYAARDSVAPWMLNNLARAFAEHGAVAKLIAVCRRAAKLPADHTSHLPLLVLAPIDALEDSDVAARALSTARRARWGDEDRFLGELAEAVIAYCKSARDLPALDDLSGALARLWQQRRQGATIIVRRVYKLVTERLARRLGTRGRRWLRDMRRLPSGR